ncbi:putative uncharacterized protein DDB_G0291608 isoform X1 [Narcine bancroftii]|uniref:putative uncharacterized protein DDB_G0291608 isoform X1 n=1 Tax=Narcine bancroftii TaxID=1343680 RepID=UPI00383118A9
MVFYLRRNENSHSLSVGSVCRGELLFLPPGGSDSVIHFNSDFLCSAPSAPWPPNPPPSHPERHFLNIAPQHSPAPKLLCGTPSPHSPCSLTVPTTLPHRPFHAPSPHLPHSLTNTALSHCPHRTPSPTPPCSVTVPATLPHHSHRTPSPTPSLSPPRSLTNPTALPHCPYCAPSSTLPHSLTDPAALPHHPHHASSLSPCTPSLSLPHSLTILATLPHHIHRAPSPFPPHSLTNPTVLLHQSHRAPSLTPPSLSCQGIGFADSNRKSRGERVCTIAMAAMFVLGNCWQIQWGSASLTGPSCLCLASAEAWYMCQHVSVELEIRGFAMDSHFRFLAFIKRVER